MRTDQESTKYAIELFAKLYPEKIRPYMKAYIALIKCGVPEPLVTRNTDPLILASAMNTMGLLGEGLMTGKIKLEFAEPAE